MKHWIRMSGQSVALAALCVLGTQGAAHAIAWPSSGELTASYSNVVRATASGNFYNEASTYAHDTFRLNDPANDSNNVYGRSVINFDEGGNYGSTQTTGEYSYSNTPVTKEFRRSLVANGRKAMAADTVWVQIGWPLPDKGSLTSRVSFAY